MVEICYGVVTRSMIVQRDTAAWMERHGYCDWGVYPTCISIRPFFGSPSCQFVIELIPLDATNFSR